MVSLKSSSSVEFEICSNSKNFFQFGLFEELSSFKVLCEHGILGMISFTFSVIFIQIKTLY